MLQEYIALQSLVFSVTEPNVIVTPNKFVQTTHAIAASKDRNLFSGYNQNDLPEFLMFLIECFHNSLAREVNVTIEENDVVSQYEILAIKCFKMFKMHYQKDYSECLDFFHGVSVNMILDGTTGQIVSTTPEPYFMINLPLMDPTAAQISPTTSEVSLGQCFEWYVSQELLTGENAFKLENGNTIDALKQIVFWSFPRILVLDLKRFNAFGQKNQCQVTFPLENLDLSEFAIGYEKDSFHYDLFAVCHHHGGVLGGHYTCFVKVKCNEWYFFNDTNCMKLEGTLEEIASKLVTPQAYCLFYRRKGSSAMSAEEA